MKADVCFAGDCLSIGADGDTIYCAGGNGEANKVGVYSASLGMMLKHFPLIDGLGHRDAVTCVASQGDVVASGSRDKMIRLWSASTGQCTAVLEGCAAQVNGLAMREDHLLSGEGSASSGTARLWSIEKASLVAAFTGHKGAVWSVAISSGWPVSPASGYGVSASHDMEAKVWPLDGTTTCVGSLPHPSFVFSVSVDQDLAATSCGDRLVRLWSLSSFTCVRTLEHGLGDPDDGKALFPYCVHLLDGVLASGGGPDKSVRLWSLSKGASASRASSMARRCAAWPYQGSDSSRASAVSTGG